MKKINFLLILTLVMKISAIAQQPIPYNLYPQNSFLLNPATMVEDNCFHAFINRQSKWSDVNSLNANTFGAYGNIAKNSYLGGMIVGDNRAIVSYFTGNLMYAHKIVFKQNNVLALGLGVGFANNSLNTEKVNVQDKNDPAFNVFNTTRVDVGFGAAYYLKKWRLGFSSPHIFDQSGNFSNQYNANLGYSFYTKTNDWKFVPSVMLRNYKSVGVLYDLMGTATWKEKVTGQVGYRTDKSIIAGIGLNWKMLTIAYAYQYHVGSEYNAFSANGTQEIQLAIKLCKKDKPVVEEKPAEKPVVEEKKPVDPNADKVATTVIMLDEKYGNPVAGNIVVKKGKTEVYAGKGDESGVSNIFLPPSKYEILVTAPGYLPQLENIDLSNQEKGSKYEIKLKPIKLEKGLVFKFKSINFETGSEKLKTSSYQILDKIADIMLENPNMVVEIAGYTDNVGDDTKNKILSEKRALSVLAYLTEKGVKTTQMKAVGYGEANPIASNDTDEGRLQNRRVMFTVIEY